MTNPDYTAWRISYQSGEQAAQAAWAEMIRLQAENQQLRKQLDEKNDESRAD
jgi:hypothetical protein